jgi:hypothetical protein
MKQYGSLWIEGFAEEFKGFQSIGIFPKQALWIKGMTSPKVLWIAILHYNLIGISTSNLTYFSLSFA